MTDETNERHAKKLRELSMIWQRERQSFVELEMRSSVRHAQTAIDALEAGVAALSAQPALQPAETQELMSADQALHYIDILRGRFHMEMIDDSLGSTRQAESMAFKCAMDTATRALHQPAETKEDPWQAVSDMLNFNITDPWVLVGALRSHFGLTAEGKPKMPAETPASVEQAMQELERIARELSTDYARAIQGEVKSVAGNWLRGLRSSIVTIRASLLADPRQPTATQCDEAAKPETGPMQDAESLSGVQELGSSGLALAEQVIEKFYNAFQKHEEWCGFNRRAPGSSSFREALEAYADWRNVKAQPTAPPPQDASPAPLSWLCPCGWINAYELAVCACGASRPSPQQVRQRKTQPT